MLTRNIFVLFVALCAGAVIARATMISATDNSLDDWNNLPEEYVYTCVCPEDATLTGLKQVKVYADLDYLCVLVEPNMDVITNLENLVPFYIIINADNDERTGGFGDWFTDPNADTMIEGCIFKNDEPSRYFPYADKWWGETGADGFTSWYAPFTYHEYEDLHLYYYATYEEMDCSSQWVNGMCEIRFKYSNIPITWNNTEFGIGFGIMNNWLLAGVLPQVSPTENNPNGRTHKLQLRVNPVSSSLLATDADRKTASVRKQLLGGQLFILLPDGSKYSATGRKVE